MNNYKTVVMVLLIRSLSIKTRSALIIGATFLCLIIGMQITFSTLVVRDAETIERDQMKDHVERVVRAIREQASQLAIKNQDWSKWDDTYQFIDDQNASYKEGNLKFEVLASLNLSHVIYFNTAGQVVVGSERKQPCGVGVRVRAVS